MAARGPKKISKLLIVGGIVCALLVVAAGVLHTRAETAAVADNQKQSAAFIKNAIPDLVVGYNLAKPLPDNQASELTKAMHAPAGSTVVIYSLDGVPVYPANATKPDADALDALTSAARGHVANVEGTDALVVFAPIQGKNDPIAVAGVSTDRSVVQSDTEGPLDAYKTPLMALAALFLLGGLGMWFAGRTRSRSKKGASAGGGAAGFGAPAAPAAVEDKAKKPGAKRSLRTKVAAEDRGSDEERAGAQEREVAIRHALEDQLEQLRTQLQTQDDRGAGAVREMQAQLAAASKRADAAEARLAQAGGATAGDAPQEQPRDREMVERLRAMDAQLGQAKASANEASARAESLEAQLAALLSAPAPSANSAELDEQLRTLRTQLEEADVRATDAGRRAEEAERAASDSEQRARSVDSIRNDLEVRLAQLGSKAGELEQKAGELEGRLSEANEGGDAVRGEIATLTSALAVANARVQELEVQAVASTDTADAVAAADAETSRLRGELALQMERAQTLEERVAALQADVFAAQRGIEELPPEGSEQVDEDFRPAFASALDEPEHALGRNEPAFAQSTAAAAEQAAASSSFASAASIVEEASVPETEVEAPAVSEPVSSGDQDSYVDAWAAAYGSPAASAEPDADPAPTSAAEQEPEFRAETESNGGGSPDDDLWALRERLARATEQASDQPAENTPS